MIELNLDKPVQTISGCPVTLLKRDAKGTYPLIGVLDNSVEQHPQCWTVNGGYLPKDGLCEMNLVNVPPRKEVEFEVTEGENLP